MTQQEYIAFKICIKEVKHTAIQNQLYEFAALSRDLERELTSLITSYGQETTDWYRVTSLDSFEYFEKIERIINQYTNQNIDESLRFQLKELYDVVMRPVIRQDIISEILGDNE